MPGKKILIFCHTAELYGASRSLLTLLQQWRYDSEMQLLLFVRTDGPLIQELHKINVQYKIIHFPLNVHFGVSDMQPISFLNTTKRCVRKTIKYLPVYRRLAKEAKLFNPDIIYTNSAVIYWGALISFFNLKKHVWHLREMKDQFQMQHELGYSIFRRLLKKSACIICNSEAVKKDYGLMNNTKAHVVYNGMFSLHEAETLFAQRAATLDNTICCGIVGGIDATKGQLEVLRGLHKWKQQSGKNFKLYIVGSADERNKQYAESLHAFVHENNLNGNVTFTGHTDDVDQYYQKMNVLISGSLSEAFGRTIPEAMARGIFVIAHNTGGIPEMVIHKETGLLYNSEDEFVSCMNAYMDKLVDAEMIRQNAFALVTKKFLKEEYAAKIKSLLLN